MTDKSAADGAILRVAPALPLGLNVKLSLMMFLQYAIWGAWLPLLWPYLDGQLKFDSTQISTMFAVGALGALVAPFIAGQLADRYFATEKFLAISHLVGGLLIWQLGWLTSYSQFLVFSLIYSLVYSPTMPLTNSLAFAHLPDRDRDFGRVRIWGTVGWIVVGIAFAQWLYHHYTPDGATEAVKLHLQAAGKADAFRLSGALGIAMAVVCWFLPHTPPSKGKQANASLEALAEIRRQPLLTLFLLAVPISCIHQFYFVHTANFLNLYQAKAERLVGVFNSIFGVGGAGMMTVGQMAELIVLAAMPWLAKALSRKTLLGIGIVGYGLRMFLFAYVDQISAATGLSPIPILLAGVAMHGLSFGGFIFVAFMVVDEETSGDVRASAQSLFNLVIIGIGVILGSWIAGAVSDWAKMADGATDYQRLFSVPMWASLACLVALLIFYPRRRKTRAISTPA